MESYTRAERLGRHRRAFILPTGSDLPSKDSAMKTTAPKGQLVELIVNHLILTGLQKEIVARVCKEFPAESQQWV